MYSAPQNYDMNDPTFQKISKKSINKDSPEDKNSLQCNVCGLIISNKWNFTLHMRVHNNDRRYKCNQCSSSFITSHDLKRHTLAHAGVRPRFKCQFCPKTYASRHSKYLHEDSHNKLVYNCRHCSEIFAKFIDRKNHEKECHFNDNVFFNCSECNKKFTSKRFLENHEKNYHKKEDDGFKCNTCGMIFETSITLNIHRRTHANKTIVVSETDPSGYQNSKVKTLKKKTPIELFGIRIHECIICTKRYTSRGDMLNHMSTCHPEENKAIFKYACDICEKSFKCKQGLSQHLITHTGEKKFSCSLCDYKSKRSADLKVHMRKHTGEAPYVCDKCGRRFQQVKSFQHHKKQHFGKIFKCDLCDASFYRNRELDWHKQKHSIGGFKCYKCGKLLANPYSLKSHLRIGKCAKGNKSSAIRRLIKLDKKVENIKSKIIKNKCYECFACGYSTYSSLDMTKHQNNHKLKETKIKKERNEGAAEPVEVEDSTPQRLNQLMKVLNSPAERVDYKGVVTVYQGVKKIASDSLPTPVNCQGVNQEIQVSQNQELQIIKGNQELQTVSRNPELQTVIGDQELQAVIVDQELQKLEGQPVNNTHSFSKSGAENLQEKVVSMNGKAFLAIDDLKKMDSQSLVEYLKALTEKEN